LWKFIKLIITAQLTPRIIDFKALRKPRIFPSPSKVACHFSGLSILLCTTTNKEIKHCITFKEGGKRKGKKQNYPKLKEKYSSSGEL